MTTEMVVGVAQVHRHRTGQRRRRRRRAHLSGPRRDCRVLDTIGDPHGTSVARSSGTRPPRKRRHDHRVGPETTSHAVRGRVGAVIAGAALTEETQLLVVRVAPRRAAGEDARRV